MQVPGLYNETEVSLTVNSGMTVLVGPNGAGKTQFMRALKSKFAAHAHNRKVRFLSAGRLSILENYRSDYDGQRGNPSYDNAQFGGSNLRQHRHQSETAYGDFHTLSIRPDIQIKVSERLKKLFKRDIYLAWDSGTLKVKFSRLDGAATVYSSAREASGLLQLVVLLTALYDDEVSVLLVDEPELSLHPQLQSFLFQEMRKISGDPANNKNKILILGTHSTEFTEIKKYTDISNIVFFKDATSEPKQISATIPELGDLKLRSFLTRIGQNQKLAFFSMRPLLVEGQSDAIICSSLESKLCFYLGAAGSQIVPVIGKGQLPTVNKFFKLSGKDPIILTDLDTIADSVQLINSLNFGNEAIKYAQEIGHNNIVQMASTIYSDFSQLVANNWNDLQAEAQNHFYWQLRKQGTDESLVRRRTILATLFIKSDEEISNFNNGLQWVSIKTRFAALLKILAKAGCFVLKKGTIENYYISSSITSLEDKPELAVLESEQIEAASIQQIQEAYRDVVECLKFASNSPEIDEAAALSDLLLSVAAPSIGRISKEMTKEQLKNISYQILNDRSTLFDLDVETSEENVNIKISCNSSILEVDGFPITFNKNSNPVAEVKSKIKPKK
jgi:hypothetical protein